jgi:uncharacterized protein YecE (DUF72 family)
MTVFIGTSGWLYAHWRNRFYPETLPQKKWLEHYAERFRVVESNNAFYRLPEPATFEAWAARTPDDFLFTVKVSRYLTHIRRLREPAEPVSRFLAHAQHLGSKLAPALLQLPPNLKADLNALDETLAEFANRVPVAVEFRHETWFSDECRSLLEHHKAALCLADGQLRPGPNKSKPMSPMWRTTSWGYLRFHQGAATPNPCYGKTALRTWAARIAELWVEPEDVFVFFNNDGRACAVRDARLFAREVERAGRTPSRVPGARDVRVG